jgi:predicted DsbA family dithiol-disulfide isomerase
MAAASTTSTNTSLATMRIDIVSDIMCPWCIVGYKRLQQAMARFADSVDFELHWQPFELNPDMPTEGQNLGEHIVEKYGSTPEQSAASRQQLIEIGQSLGFTFNFSEQSRIYNTAQAHQLLHWAGETGAKGQQHALKMALFTGYFTEQNNPSDIDVLIATATKIGLDADEARAVLADKRYEQAVKANQNGWMVNNISAVPAIILAEQYLISGAQESDTLAEAIEQVLGLSK